MPTWAFRRSAYGHCLISFIYLSEYLPLIRQRGCTAVMCEAVCCMDVAWPVRKGNVVALQRAEMRLVRWMCGVKLKDRLPSKELREWLGIDDIALVLQQNRLRWYGHVLRKEDNDWVKKCMEYEVEGPWPRGRPKTTWREVVEKVCQARTLNKVDAVDHSIWSYRL